MGFTRWLLRPRDKQVLRRADICQGPYLCCVVISGEGVLGVRSSKVVPIEAHPLLEWIPSPRKLWNEEHIGVQSEAPAVPRWSAACGPLVPCDRPLWSVRFPSLRCWPGVEQQRATCEHSEVFSNTTDLCSVSSTSSMLTLGNVCVGARVCVWERDKNTPSIPAVLKPRTAWCVCVTIKHSVWAAAGEPFCSVVFSCSASCLRSSQRGVCLGLRGHAWDLVVLASREATA